MEENIEKKPPTSFYVAWDTFNECVVGVFSTKEKYQEYKQTKVEASGREFVVACPFLVDPEVKYHVHYPFDLVKPDQVVS